ncbi:MAG: HDOD domain-containing protein [Burkholderiales bacterium]|nr:HDOD domain-containing protein [Burkholderiales bacterium]
MQPLKLEQVVAKIQRLPSLPAVVVEVLESFEDEHADAGAIGKKIAQDQALSAKVLRVANSSFYGLAGKVVTVQDALVVLGFRNVRILVMAAGVTGSFPAVAAGWFDLRVFWMHAIVTAVCARTFAADAGIEPDRAFTAGLLHDIGRIVLATCFPDHYRDVAQYRALHDCQPIEAERHVLGLDHAAVGGALAERWKFAPVIQQAVAAHHCTQNTGVSGAKPDLAGLVHVADVAAHALDLAGDANELVPQFNAVTWKRMDMSWPQFRQRLGEAERLAQGAALLLAA